MPRWGHNDWETYYWFSLSASSGRKTATILTKWLTHSSVCHGGQERPRSNSDQSPLNTHYTVIKTCTGWNDIFRKLKTYTRENKFFRYRDVHWRKWLFRASLCWLERLATPLHIACFWFQATYSSSLFIARLPIPGLIQTYITSS